MPEKRARKTKPDPFKSNPSTSKSLIATASTSAVNGWPTLDPSDPDFDFKSYEALEDIAKRLCDDGGLLQVRHCAQVTGLSYDAIAAVCQDYLSLSTTPIRGLPNQALFTSRALRKCQSSGGICKKMASAAVDHAQSLLGTSDPPSLYVSEAIRIHSGEFNREELHNRLEQLNEMDVKAARSSSSRPPSKPMPKSESQSREPPPSSNSELTRMFPSPWTRQLEAALSRLESEPKFDPPTAEPSKVHGRLSDTWDLAFYKNSIDAVVYARRIDDFDGLLKRLKQEESELARLSLAASRLSSPNKEHIEGLRVRTEESLTLIKRKRSMLRDTEIRMLKELESILGSIKDLPYPTQAAEGLQVPQ